jgi:hypothetical protein
MRCEIIAGRRGSGKTTQVVDKIARGEVVQPVLYFDHQHPFESVLYQQKTEQRRAAVAGQELPDVLGTVVIDDCMPHNLRHFEPDRRFNHIFVVQNIRDVPPRLRNNSEVFGEGGVPIDPFINDTW